MLILIGPHRHGLEVPFCLDGVHELLVHGEVPDWGAVLIAGGCGGTSEIVVVGGS